MGPVKKKPSLVELGQQLQQLALDPSRGPEWVKSASELPEQIARSVGDLFAKLPQTTKPKAYAYGRLSLLDEDEKAAQAKLDAKELPDSIVAQGSELRNYYEKHLAPSGVQWGGFFPDAGVSAFSKPFLARPKACELNAIAQRGDHILILKLDRAFRNRRDYLGILKLWHQRGINVHFTAHQIDGNTIGGKMMLDVLSMVAEAESQMQSERRRLALKKNKERGFARPYPKPYGQKLVKCGRHHRLVDDEEERVILKEIVRLRELCTNCGHRNNYPTERFNRCDKCGARALGFIRIGRLITKGLNDLRPWTQSVVPLKAFRAEKRLQAQAATKNQLHGLNGQLSGDNLNQNGNAP